MEVGGQKGEPRLVPNLGQCPSITVQEALCGSLLGPTPLLQLPSSNWVTFLDPKPVEGSGY